MCTVSMVGDYYTHRTFPSISSIPSMNNGFVTRAEFEAVKKSIEELRILLLAAKKYDEALGEPHCEHEDKVKLIKQIAKAVGVDLKGVLD